MLLIPIPPTKKRNRRIKRIIAEKKNHERERERDRDQQLTIIRSHPTEIKRTVVSRPYDVITSWWTRVLVRNGYIA